MNMEFSMSLEEAKKIFINRGFIEVNGGTLFDGDSWRNACYVISKWLEEENITWKQAQIPNSQ